MYLYHMKMLVTEKQLASLLGKNKEIDEADSMGSPSTTNQSTSIDSAPASSTISASSSGDGSGSSPSAADYPPYPEVGHWESGVARGAANQISPTSKWSEVVGSTLTRGKANPLK